MSGPKTRERALARCLDHQRLAAMIAADSRLPDARGRVGLQQYAAECYAEARALYEMLYPAAAPDPDGPEAGR